jgi:hypothetical protein
MALKCPNGYIIYQNIPAQDFKIYQNIPSQDFKIYQNLYFWYANIPTGNHVTDTVKTFWVGDHFYSSSTYNFLCSSGHETFPLCERIFFRKSKPLPRLVNPFSLRIYLIGCFWGPRSERPVWNRPSWLPASLERYYVGVISGACDGNHMPSESFGCEKLARFFDCRLLFSPSE